MEHIVVQTVFALFLQLYFLTFDVGNRPRFPGLLVFESRRLLFGFNSHCDCIITQFQRIRKKNHTKGIIPQKPLSYNIPNYNCYIFKYSTFLHVLKKIEVMDKF